MLAHHVVDEVGADEAAAAGDDDAGGLEGVRRARLHSRCTALTHKSTRTIVARAHPALQGGALGYTRNEQEVKALL